MIRGKLLSFLALTIFWAVSEAKLEIFFEDCYFEDVNPEYISQADTYVLEEGSNENSIVLNVTIIKEVPVDAEASLSLLGDSMGEYVVETGVSFEMSLCEAFDEPVIIGPFIGALGLTKDDCPIRVGNYGSTGYELKTDGLPDEFPPNKYRAAFKISLEGEPIITAIFIGRLEVFFEDCYFEDINPEYVSQAETYVLEEGANENSIVFNITVIKEVPVEAETSLNLLGYSMGEYVLETGIVFDMSLCEAFAEPMLIGPFIGALGLTEDDCPIKVGNYGSTGYEMKTDGFPDEFPPNKYKTAFKITLEGEPILTAVFISNVQ